MPGSFRQANLAAFLLPALLMMGALGSQYLGGLFPCQMCHWQRWPHYAAIALAGLAFFVKPPAKPVLITFAVVAILISGSIGVFHAGVEYKWWPGLTACASMSHGGGLADIMNTAPISCDIPQWMLAGISLAGFNALFSLGGGMAIIALLSRRR